MEGQEEVEKYVGCTTDFKTRWRQPGSTFYNIWDLVIWKHSLQSRCYVADRLIRSWVFEESKVYSAKLKLQCHNSNSTGVKLVVSETLTWSQYGCWQNTQSGINRAALTQLTGHSNIDANSSLCSKVPASWDPHGKNYQYWGQPWHCWQLWWYLLGRRGIWMWCRSC